MQKSVKIIIGVLGVAVIGFFMFYFGGGEMFQGRLSKDLSNKDSRDATESDILTAVNPKPSPIKKLPNLVFLDGNATGIFIYCSDVECSMTYSKVILASEGPGRSYSYAKCALALRTKVDKTVIGVLDKFDNGADFMCPVGPAEKVSYEIYLDLTSTEMKLNHDEMEKGQFEPSDLEFVVDIYDEIAESNEDDNTFPVQSIEYK